MTKTAGALFDSADAPFLRFNALEAVRGNVARARNEPELRAGMLSDDMAGVAALSGSDVAVAWLARDLVGETMRDTVSLLAEWARERLPSSGVPWRGDVLGVVRVREAASMRARVQGSDAPLLTAEMVFADLSYAFMAVDVTGRVEALVSTSELPVPYALIDSSRVMDVQTGTVRSLGETADAWESDGAPQLFRMLSVVSASSGEELDLLV